MRHSVNDWLRLPASRGMQVNCREISRGFFLKMARDPERKALKGRMRQLSLYKLGMMTLRDDLKAAYSYQKGSYKN